MHVLTTPSPISLDNFGTLDPGEYMCEDHNAAQLMLRCPHSSMGSVDRCDTLTCEASIDNILIVGTLALGDALMLTPCLRAIKAAHPKASLHIACFRESQQVFLGLPYVDGFESYPTPLDVLRRYDCVLTLEYAVEHNAKAREQHMTDRYAEHLGLGAITDHKPDLFISGDEREWITSTFPKSGKRRIGVQVQAGARMRTYPQANLVLFVNALVRKGYEVWLMGRPGEFNAQEKPGLHNLSRHGLTWRQSAAFLTTCDGFVGPDSSLLHAAGTLGVPSVGLFGPYPWEIRTKYYPSVFALQGTSGCTTYPCFHQPRLGTPLFPIDQPCAATGRCEVMASIEPERILSKLEQQIGPA